MKVTKESLELVEDISNKINNKTFHHHYHILYDIGRLFSKKITYLEIGCYAGGSACLMLQRPNTEVISIDLGKPISHSVAKGNVESLNKHNNKFSYIEGDSHAQSTISKLETILGNSMVDILFIDGDHSRIGVIKDFEIYSKYVNSGGYIVFDDYNDSQHSPQVKTAVDSLIFNDYKFIGTFGNEFNARPINHPANEYVIRKN